MKELIRKIAALAGIDTQESPKTAEPLLPDGRFYLKSGTSPGKIVFVLVDGMGESILRRLRPGSFLAGNQAGTLRSVFPSTTACAMTTVATALSPAEHGLPGRNSYLRERDLHVNTLSFRTKEGNILLTGGDEKAVHGPPVPISRLYPFQSLIPAMKVPTYTVVPRVLMGSPFASYLFAGTPAAGYSSISEGVDSIIAATAGMGEKGYAFFYIWDLDSLCHETGPSHPSALELLRNIDRELDRLRAALGRDTLLVVTADHGQIDISVRDRHILTPDHPAAGLLATPPFGEPRAAQFLVRPGSEEAFADRFLAGFGDCFDLLPARSPEAARLFGGVPFSPEAERNMGTYLAVARGRNILIWDDGLHPPVLHTGEHGGDLPEERLIPLIVA